MRRSRNLKIMLIKLFYFVLSSAGGESSISDSIYNKVEVKQKASYVLKQYS